MSGRMRPQMHVERRMGVWYGCFTEVTKNKQPFFARRHGVNSRGIQFNSLFIFLCIFLRASVRNNLYCWLKYLNNLVPVAKFS